MNDLERDLQRLFETKARSVDATPGAPVAVLRRGRRRQVGTVIGGAIGGLAVIAVAVAAVLSVTGSPPNIPANTNGLPERTTTIGGVPVTAPAGWTLVNDWPLAALLTTSSETCTFTGVGTPVGGSGSEQETAAGEETCVRTPTDVPAGVPVLQLANFEVPLFETVCGLGDQPATALPSDGVAVYVGAFPGGLSTGALMAACPGSERVRDADVVVTFSDDSLETAYGAVLIVGPSATTPDIEVGRGLLADLAGTRIEATVPSTEGPGYVLLTGDGRGGDWRLEAGVTQIGDDLEVGASLVITGLDGERATSVAASSGDTYGEAFEDLGDGVIHLGTASDTTQAIEVLAAEEMTRATRLEWPVGLKVIGVPVEGWLWIAETPVRGEVYAFIPSRSASLPAG